MTPLLLSGALAICIPASQGLAIESSEFIYDSAPFPSCHASTIVETRSGRTLAAWFGGTAESAPDVRIYLSELRNNRWSVPRAVAAGVSDQGEARACYNPVLFQASSGPLMLFYKVGTGPQTWWGMLTKSSDEGDTWDNPQKLPEGILGPIKNKPIEIKPGVLLCPSSTEHDGWRVHFETTTDFGATWNKGNPVNDPKRIGAIQPSILRTGDRSLRAVGRTQQGKLFAVDSSDNGQSWGQMQLIDLPNPNSGCDAMTLSSGRHMLVYNHTNSGRSPLNVAISVDGINWKSVLTLEDSPGEYSYPSIMQSRDGKIHITYTWQRKKIKHVVLTEIVTNGSTS